MIDSALVTYNIAIYKEFKVKHKLFQIGFFNDNKILFIGQNPGMPFNSTVWNDTNAVINQSTLTEFEKHYEQMIRKYQIGQYITKIINNKWHLVSLTNAIKIPTENNAKPTIDLTNEFMPILKQQIKLLSPELIICFGKFVGSLFDLAIFYQIVERKTSHYLLVPHPSYINRYGNVDIETTKINALINNFFVCNRQ